MKGTLGEDFQRGGKTQARYKLTLGPYERDMIKRVKRGRGEIEKERDRGERGERRERERSMEERKERGREEKEEKKGEKAKERREQESGIERAL